MMEAPPRDFDVVRFYGSYRKAMDVLGWKPVVSLDEGLNRLVDSIRANFYVQLECSQR